MMPERRNIFASVLAIMIMIAVAIPLTATIAQDGVTARANNNVNLRSGPSVTYPRFDVIPFGTVVPVSARNADSSWIVVEYDGQQGWMAAWTATVTGNLSSLPVSDEIFQGKPAQIYFPTPVNIRSGPGVGYEIRGQVAAGSTLYPLARNASNTWLVVDYEGVRGWIAKWVVRVEGDTSALPVTDDADNVPAPGDPSQPGDPNAPTSTPTEIPSGPTPTSPPPPAGPPPEDPNAVGLHVQLTHVGPHLRDIYLRGQSQGRLPYRFSKVGDSETDQEFYLKQFDEGFYRLADYGYLEGVVDYYAGSYIRDSQSAKSGYVVETLLNPLWSDKRYCQKEETPLECEFRLNRPVVSIILIRTYPDQKNQDAFKDNLRQVVQSHLDHGVIPVLTTIPWIFNPGGIELQMNERITEVANEYNVPLWDLWATTYPLPNHGTRQNDHHLSIPPDGAATVFTEPYLTQYGVNVRNLETLEVLYTILHQVIQP